MNRSEAAPLFAALCAAFKQAPDKQTTELWFNACFGDVPQEAGEAVVRRLISEDKFWPTPARFNEVRRALYDFKGVRNPDGTTTRTYVAKDAEQPALQAGPKTQEERDNVARFFRLCREIVASHDKRPHWHGGPEKCWCGGIDPNWKSVAKKKLHDAAKGMTNPNNPSGERYGRPAPWNCQTVERITVSRKA